jgi:hypothetical protein
MMAIRTTLAQISRHTVIVNRLFLLILAIILVTNSVNAKQTSPTPPIAIPTYEGRIAVAPQGRYFVDEAGQGFIFASENITRAVRVSDGAVLRAGCADDRTGIVWLAAQGGEDAVRIPGVTVTLDGVFADGEYAVEYWDTYAGDVLHSAIVTVTERALSVVIPELDDEPRSLVLVVRALA